MVETQKETLRKLNLLVYTRVLSCLGLLPVRLSTAGEVRLSALSLWVGRAFVAYSSEYITKAILPSLEALVELPEVTAGQAERGQWKSAPPAFVVDRTHIRCLYLRLLPTKLSAVGKVQLSAPSLWFGHTFVAYSSEYITKAKPPSLFVPIEQSGATADQVERGRLFVRIEQSEATADQVERGRWVQFSAPSLWFGHTFVAYSSEYITKAKPPSLFVPIEQSEATADQVERGRLRLLPTKLSAVGKVQLSAPSLWFGHTFVAYSSEYITKAKPPSLFVPIEQSEATADQVERGR
ncbi:hypothetical protein EVAR_31403_1 [Eumeta japonica]|uniref:Uncharacterized protein n=1 Tax=Eumeta variegata TaxID=151549 RepID=A0A4C1UYC8_EUMVA|nr:hypothetical protein EVAR_31403_1 [Eumeta japonica]